MKTKLTNENKYEELTIINNRSYDVDSYGILSFNNWLTRYHIMDLQINGNINRLQERYSENIKQNGVKINLFFCLLNDMKEIAWYITVILANRNLSKDNKNFINGLDTFDLCNVDWYKEETVKEVTNTIFNDICEDNNKEILLLDSGNSLDLIYKNISIITNAYLEIVDLQKQIIKNRQIEVSIVNLTELKDQDLELENINLRKLLKAIFLFNLTLEELFFFGYKNNFWQSYIEDTFIGYIPVDGIEINNFNVVK